MKKFSLTLEVVLMALYFTATAQNLATGILQGRVFDEQTNEIISSVPIVLLQNGIQKAAAETNDSGSYLISEISPGTYDIRIAYGRYQPMIIKSIMIDSAATAVLNIPMKQSTDKLGEVVVVAEKIIRLVELAKEILELSKTSR